MFDKDSVQLCNQSQKKSDEKKRKTIMIVPKK